MFWFFATNWCTANNTVFRSIFHPTIWYCQYPSRFLSSSKVHIVYIFFFCFAPAAVHLLTRVFAVQLYVIVPKRRIIAIVLVDFLCQCLLNSFWRLRFSFACCVVPREEKPWLISWFWYCEYEVYGGHLKWMSRTWMTLSISMVRVLSVCML